MVVRTGYQNLFGGVRADRVDVVCFSEAKKTGVIHTVENSF